MKYLICAEQYVEARGEEAFFKWVYSVAREHNNVNDSVWKALSYMYGDTVADAIKLSVV